MKKQRMVARVVVSMPAGLLRSARALARREGRSLSEVMRVALRRELAAERARSTKWEPPTAALREPPGGSLAMRVLDMD